MPLYDYICTHCHYEKEVIQKMDEQPLVCPVCLKKMKKKLSTSHFRLYGEGFYKENARE